MTSVPTPHTERRVAVGLGVAAFGWYAITCCPTVHWADSGELIVAGVVLGIPHPPGHPLYAMLAHLFTWLPVASPAWRINLLSAVFGAVTVAVTFRLAAETLRRIGAGPRQAVGCALFASCLMMVTVGLWGESTVAETTTLHTAFMAGLMWLVWRTAWVQPTGAPLLTALGAAAALYGFSATNHVAGIVFLPAFAVLLIGRCGRQVLRPRAVATMCACVLAGLVLYAYLPLRSSQNPVLDWGNPETLENFRWVVTAQQYQGLMRQGMSAVASWAALGDRGVLMAREWTFPGVALLVWGLLTLARRTPWFAGFIVLAWAPLIGLALSEAFILAYIVPGLPLLAVALACGSHAFLTWAPRLPVPVSAAAACAVALWSGWLHYPEAARQHNDSGEVYARALLDTLEPNAILFTTVQNHAFNTWAIQTAMGYRPDVAVLNPDWVVTDLPTRADMAARYPDVRMLSEAEAEDMRAQWPGASNEEDFRLAAIVTANIGARPLYVGTPQVESVLVPYLTPAGEVYRFHQAAMQALEPTAVADTRTYWLDWAARLESRPALRDPYLLEAVTMGLNNQGMYFEGRGRTDLAAWNYDTAIAIDPRASRPYLNRGRLRGFAQDWDSAYADFERAIEADPRFGRAHYYLGWAEVARGHPEAAYRAFQEALLWSPNDGDALRETGRLLMRAGELDLARTYLERAVSANPRDSGAARTLAAVALQQHDYDAAGEALQRAHALEPENVSVLLLMAAHAAQTGGPAAADLLAEAFRVNGPLAAEATADASWAQPLLAQLGLP